MAPGRPVKLEDVAREAGVSAATVSHALSGKGRLPDATRARVREVARRMGYSPNPAARRLAGGRSGLIAVAFSLSDALPVALTDVDYFSQAIHAATERALQRDFALVVAPPTPQTAVWSRIPLDGVVVFDPVAGDPVLADLRARGIPLVLSGRDPAGGDDYCVDNDHIAGTRAVLDHLTERGARRIGILTGEPVDAFNADCLAAYRSWCDEHGADHLAQTAPVGHMAELEWPDRLLASDEPADAVYANTEVLGLATLRAARRRNLRVPDDLMLAVAADREPAGADLALTTLELDPVRTAAEAIDVLVELIEGRPPAERLRLIPTHLVPRASTVRA
jgi:DNA-binding LacI/PurR family transcriptional regulator